MRDDESKEKQLQICRNGRSPSTHVLEGYIGARLGDFIIAKGSPTAYEIEAHYAFAPTLDLHA